VPVLPRNERLAVAPPIEHFRGMELTIQYPENLPDALHQTREQFEREAKMAMAVKLFELRRISSGMAAALVGMDRVSFLLSLHRYGVPMIDLDEEELASDLQHA
jgi:predicted HTH domain antitoxin